MSLEIFARQSVAAFMHIYAEVYTGEAIKPEELEAIIWGRLCAKEAGISQMSIKMPYDNIRRSKVTLPYMPDHINYTGCPVIKKNGGLYTPCCTKVEKEALYCKTCIADKEGKPKEIEFGLLDDREQNIEEGNFAPITYAEWMKGHKTTLPEVYAKLAAQGIQIEIPAEELICRTLPKNRRGRKSKPEDEDEAEPVKPKRKPKAPEADSSSEEEAPKPVPKKPPAKPTHKASPAPSPVASPEASDSDSSEDEAPVRGTSLDKAKPSPVASPVASPAVSDSEKPKAKAAPKAAPKKAASPASSDGESKKVGPAVRPPKEVKAPKAPKEVKAKAEPKAEPKAEKPAKKEKAAKAPKEAKEPKAAKAPKADKKKAEPATAEEEPEEFEAEFEQQHGDKVVDAGDGQDYIQRGEILFTMDGRIVGRVVTGEDDEDEVEWTDGRE
jgi:hypothetical protein